MHRLELVTVALLTVFAAVFNILGTSYVNDIEKSKMFYYISGLFWASSGIILIFVSC